MGHLPRIILLVVLVIFSLGAAFYTWRTHESLEGFSEEEAYSVISDDGSHYHMRIYVMKIFDALLKRKPTSDELDTYSSMQSETDVLNNVLEHYRIGSTSSVIELVAIPSTSRIADEERPESNTSTAAPSVSTFPGITTTYTAETGVKSHAVTDDTPATKKQGLMCVDKRKILFDLKQITDRVNAFHDQFNQM